MRGKLYIVATPIGNLDDISPRSLEILRSVDSVLCEDTRVTSKLLNHYDIKRHTLSYHQHSGDTKMLEILKMLIDGKNLALVTDAGTPSISDPGNELIDYLLDKEPEIEVIPVPGASSLTAALSICGFNLARFIFVGFLPKKRLKKIFTQVKNSGYAMVFFESPRRILKTLDRLVEEFGDDRRVFVARELTKLHEETYRGTLSEVREKMASSDPRGEVTVVVEGEKIV